MAKPNYSFEKRQRELAKKRKKEDKIAERAARKAGGGLPAEGPAVTVPVPEGEHVRDAAPAPVPSPGSGA